MLMLLLYQMIPVMPLAIDLNWSKIIDPIYELFMGNEEMMGIFESELLLGGFIFLVLMLMTLMFGLGMLIGSVVIIPSLFAIFNYVPNLRVIVAIILGLMFGLGLNRMIRR